jgi:O-antigen ligase
LGLGLALGLVCAIKNNHHLTRLSPPLAWTAVAGLGVVALCALVSPTPLLGLLGRYPRYEGLPMLVGYFCVVLLGAWLCGRDAPARRGHALSALAVLETVLAAWAIVETVATPQARITTPLGNASDVGVMSVVGFGVLAWFAVKERGWLLWTGTFASAILVGLTASRGAWLGLGLVVVAIVILTAVRRQWRATWPVFVAGVAGVLIAALTPLARSRGLGTSPLSEQTVSGRLLLWRETVHLWLDHLWLGAGSNRFVDGIGQYHTAEWARVVGPDNPPDSPHNVILQVTASYGILGLAVALVFAVFLIRTLWVARNDDWAVAAFLALVGAATCYLFHFTSLWNITPLLVMVGGACSLPAHSPIAHADPDHQPSKDRAAESAPRPWAQLGWLCVCGVSALLGLGLGIQSMTAETLLATSLSQLTAGNETGLSTIQQATLAKPQDPDLAWRAGHALTVLSGAGLAPPEAAVTMLTDACDGLPGSVECLNDLALAHLYAGDPSNAQSLLHEARALDPVNITTLLLLGSARDGLGDPEGAEQAFLEAANLRPSSPDPWSNLALLYTKQGRTADAQAAQATADELSG